MIRIFDSLLVACNY